MILNNKMWYILDTFFLDGLLNWDSYSSFFNGDIIYHFIITLNLLKKESLCLSEASL